MYLRRDAFDSLDGVVNASHTQVGNLCFGYCRTSAATTRCVVKNVVGRNEGNLGSGIRCQFAQNSTRQSWEKQAVRTIFETRRIYGMPAVSGGWTYFVKFPERKISFSQGNRAETRAFSSAMTFTDTSQCRTHCRGRGFFGASDFFFLDRIFIGNVKLGGVGLLWEGESEGEFAFN